MKNIIVETDFQRELIIEALKRLRKRWVSRNCQDGSYAYELTELDEIFELNGVKT